MPEQKRTARGVLGGFLGFIGLSAAAGILLTAAVTPALAVTGMTANNAISVFDGIPDYLKIGQSMEKSNIYATQSNGQPYLLASFYDQNREEVAWEDVSQFAKDAAVAAEDPRFYSHGGIDVMGTTRAILKTYIIGGETQGGSSITQQYVKNVLVQQCEMDSKNNEELEACANEATTAEGASGASRKLKEMRYAIGVEKDYSKDEILLGYLNIANFGARTYGIEAASKYYFGVSAADLNVEQAATLVAIVNNPNNLRIDRPDAEVNGSADGYKQTKIRRDYVLNDMLEHGKITDEQHAAAIAAPITPNIVPPSTGCATAGGSAYFCDYVTWVVKQDPAFGETAEERASVLRRGGLNIYTTLDLDIQAAAESSMNQYIPKSKDTVDLGSAAVTVEPGTGRVLAMTQNKSYSNDAQLAASSNEYTAVNYSTDQKHGGSTGFQVGSSYKVFALVEWLKEGHSLNEPVNATRRPFSRFTDTCDGDWTSPPNEVYNPRNYDGSSAASITPYEATKRSVNTAFIAMAQKLDLCEIRKTAEDLGVERADGKRLNEFPSSVLGSNEISPLSMATAFAAIAAEGTACDAIAIDKITGPSGEELTAPSADCRQAITPEVANTAAYAMQSVMSPGGTGANAAVSGAPLFGKTGTADDANDTWITAGTTEAVTSFWIGNVQARASDGRKISMYDATVNNGLTGYQAKYRVWAGIASAMIAKLGGNAFPGPDDSLLKRKQIAVPNVVGSSVEQAEATLSAAGFSSRVGAPIDSTTGAGLVAASEPGAGSTVAYGSTIVIRPSTGTPPPTVPNVVGEAPDAARSMLASKGFENVAETCEPDAKQSAAGKVTKQTPAAGAAASSDEEISITVRKKACD